MGAVYRAVDTRLGRDAALKLSRPIENDARAPVKLSRAHRLLEGLSRSGGKLRQPRAKSEEPS